jgi:methyl-accepting chemotaxis protein
MSNRTIIAVLRRWRAGLLVGLGCCVGMAGLILMFGFASVQNALAGVLPWSSGIAVSAFFFLIATNLIGAFIIIRLIREKRQTKAAVDNMSQGLAMFDASGRLVVFNARYAELYALSSDWLASCPMLDDLLEERRKIGKFKGDPKERMDALMALMRAGKVNKEVREVTGRVYSIANWPMSGGGWVSTHDDITEQQREGIERDRLAGLEQRRVTLDVAIADFRMRIEGMLATVGESAASLRTTAEALFAASDQASQRAKSAVQNSNSASTSVEVAAAAAEQLSSSIADISRQLAQTNSLVELAVGEASTTDDEMDRLAQAAEKIGAVVRLIHEVAGQTNLLALNATIEAARAGEAGRGFAVVASEVKSLALQTGKSTEEIAAQIAAVQASAGTAVEAIRRIVGRMEEISSFTSGTASAVQEQDTATGHISQNVTTAAAETKEVVTLLGLVATAVSETHGSAQSVLNASTAVDSAAGQLRAEVESFLKKVAA